MEMNDSALLQMMSTQNSILEEIKNLHRRNETRHAEISLPQGQLATPPTPLFQPTQYYDTGIEPKPLDIYEPPQMATTAVPPLTVQAPPTVGQVPAFDTSTAPSSVMPPLMPVNPTSYSTVAANQPPKPMSFAPQAIGDNTKQAVDDVFNYDGSRMSAKSREAYVSDTSQSLQLGAVNTASSAASVAGGASAFLVSGLVPSLAVGASVAAVAAYGGNQMVEGTQASLNYQNILRDSGYKALNAFETTNEFGGIGFSLDDRQELSGFLRELSVDEYLTDDEMGKILQGSLDNKLLKSVNDVKSFKEKFTKLVDTVKEVAVMMDQSLEETTAFLGEMERLGISSDKYTQVAAYAKTGAAMLGMDANQYSQLLVQQAETVVNGTGMDASTVIEGISNNAYIVEGISELSGKQDGLLKQYIKNNGGSSAVAGDIENTIRSSIQENAELQKMLLSVAAPVVKENEYGNMELDSTKLSEILSSDKSLRTMMNESSAYTQSMDANDLMRLSSGFGSALNNTGTQGELYSLINKMKEMLMKEYGMDENNAIQQLGLADNDTTAQLVNQTLIAGSDEDVQKQFDAKVLKEIMDAENITDSPGLGKTFKYWMKKNIGSHFGDAGAWMSDEIGDISQDIQMRLRGIEETGIVGADLHVAFDDKFSENVFEGEESLVSKRNELVNNFDSLKEKNESTKPSHYQEESGYRPETKAADIQPIKEPELETITNDEFKYLIDAMDNGEFGADQLKEIQEKLSSGNLHKSTVEQYEYILNKAQGEYEADNWWGVPWAKTKQLFSYSGASMHWGSFRKTGEDTKAGSGFDSLEAIEDEEKHLKKIDKDLQKALNTAVLDSAHTPEEVEEIQQAIRSGDYELVQQLTTEGAFREVGQDYTDYMTKIQTLNEAKDLYFDVQDHTLAYGKATEGAFKLLKSSDIFTDEEFDSYFGGKADDITDIIKDLPEMNDQEMYEASEQLKRTEDIFQNLSSAKKLELAEYITQATEAESMDFLYKEGTQTIDGAKIYEYLMDMGQHAQSGKNAAEGAIEDSDVSETMGQHENMLGKVLDTMVSEIDRLQDAVNTLKTTSSRKYTSAST